MAVSFLGNREDLGLFHCLVDLSQVVECNFRLRHLRQLFFNLLIPACIPKRAVTKPATRHTAQLFLDAFQFRANIPALARMVSSIAQNHRIDRREPPHRPRYIHPLHHLFPPVPFHIHQHSLPSAPLRHHSPQCRQQHIVDLRVVHLRYLLQQLPRLFFLQPHHHPLLHPHQVPLSSLSSFSSFSLPRQLPS